MSGTALKRAEVFCERFGLRLPILMAPMASSCPPSLAAAVANAGGMGGCGALMMQPAEMKAWAEEVRAHSNGAFQFNLWIPDPAPVRDPQREAATRAFLGKWGPEVPASAGDGVLPDFEAQCETMLEIGTPVISSVMGIYPPEYVAKMKARGVTWFATVTTVTEARAAVRAGADVIVAQGAEAGGHRGSFDSADAERQTVGLFSLLPAVVDAAGKLPVVAAGGIADGRQVAASLILGASAVAVGTGLLRSPEAKLPKSYADAIGRALPEETILSRAYSGRAGRGIATTYALAATAPDAPLPAPYPVQRGLTAPMRAEAAKADDYQRMQAWAGQSAALSKAAPAGEIVREMWEAARELLS